MTDVTVLDQTRSAWDVAHDQQRFDRLGLTRDNILSKMAEAATEIAGWGAGNEAAVIRFAMAEIVRLRAEQNQLIAGHAVAVTRANRSSESDADGKGEG